MRPDYAALDAAITKRIAAGSDPYGGDADKEARKLEAASSDDPRRRKYAFRFIDTRLQTLRRTGKIKHDRKAGWLIA